MKPQKPTYIVVIGASAGGFNALAKLAEILNPDADAAYLVVLHLAKYASGIDLIARLQQRTKIKCHLAKDQMDIEAGSLYLAKPDYHLLVSKDKILLGSSARENRWRPSIDVLFRTAAADFTTRVIGVILSGMLNDGTTGMSAIKRSGGMVIVQDPDEAEFPDMPRSVIQNVQVDFIAPIHKIAEILVDVTKDIPQPAIDPPADIVAESEMELRLISSVQASIEKAELTPYTCPDCGGVLFKHDQDTITRYKCHTGHSFTLRDLSIQQSMELESSLWYAIRSLEQKKYLYQSLQEPYTQAGILRLAEDYKSSELEIERHIKVLKEILVNQDRLKQVE